MKPLILTILMMSSAGCATLGAVSGTPGGARGAPGAAGYSAPEPASEPAPPATDMSPRIIMPATGGAPIFGIPLGGSLFLPVTGGEPVFGIPVSP